MSAHQAQPSEVEHVLDHPAKSHLVWFRDDLRTDDHPALAGAIQAAQRAGGTVVAVYIYDPALWNRDLGGASLWWLHHSLTSLRDCLQRLGVPLCLKKGKSAEVLAQMVADHRVSDLWWMAGQTPFLRQAEKRVSQAVSGMRLRVHCEGSALWAEPDALKTGGGTPFKVFSPFWKALAARLPEISQPIAVPDALSGQTAPDWAAGEDLRDWGFLPTTPDWAGGLRAHWQPGEDGALNRLGDFLQGTVLQYKARRDYPATPGTSRLSPHLRFGEISPRRIWAATVALHGEGATAFLREVGWREFNHHLLFQFPAMAEKPLRPEFAAFPWREEPHEFRRWCKGMTGFPIVDAGMRELWQTGYMHNRVRMITGSFLVKDLLLPWQWGEEWMWDTLVDACPANNPGNWQWVSGCGADAAPYFRIFNPTLQAQKFDGDAAYQRHWVPEMDTDPNDLFAPSSGYPLPMVDHKKARDRALAALESIKATGGRLQG